jgi:hypothetical protein
LHRALLLETRPQARLSHESEHVAAFEQAKLVPVDMHYLIAERNTSVTH